MKKFLTVFLMISCILLVASCREKVNNINDAEPTKNPTAEEQIDKEIKPIEFTPIKIRKGYPGDNSNIAMSNEILKEDWESNLMHKQLDGYKEGGYSTVWNYSESIISSEEGKRVYKTKKHYCELIRKYENEIFFKQYGDAEIPLYKAVNIKTGKVRAFLPRKINDKEETYPIIYKDKLYVPLGKERKTKYQYYFFKFGALDVYDVNGNKHGENYIEPLRGNNLILGIAYDKLYFVSKDKNINDIHCATLDGTAHSVIADGFKMRTTYDVRYKGKVSSKYGLGKLSFDNTSWYFIGGNKKPYWDLCKVDFATGKAEVVKENVDSFEVNDKNIYYTERISKNKRSDEVYCMNKKTKKTKFFWKKQGQIYELALSKKYLYVGLERVPLNK